MIEKTQASTKDRIANSARDSIDSASKTAHPAVDRAAAGAHKTVDNADQLADKAGEAMDKAGAKGEQLVKASSSYVREHPLVSIGIAVTAGYVLSSLLSSR